MLPGRNINNVTSNPGADNPMFFSKLSSATLSSVPCSRVGFRSSSTSSSYYRPHFTSPRPCFSVQRFPPWTPPLPQLHPVAGQVFSGRTWDPRWRHPSNFNGYWHSFNTSAGLMMERHNREKGPPPKRKKSAEDKRAIEEREGHRGAAAEVTRRKDGGPKMEQQLPLDIHPRPNHRFRDGSRDKWNNESGKSGRKDRDKDRQQKQSTGRDETPDRGWIAHHQGGHRGSQPVRSMRQTSISQPEEERAPRDQPNPWFKDKGIEERGGCGSRTKGPLKDSCRDGELATGLVSHYCSTDRPRNHWQVAGSNREPPPPPPGTYVPFRKWEDAKLVKTLRRHWEAPDRRISVQLPGSSTAFDFSVMSYNILAQELLQDNAYLYHHCNPGVLHWNHRLPNLLAEIRKYNADILCLQEVQEDHYENQIKPALHTLGYQCEYKKRTGEKPDGCAIIFKSSRLSLLSSNPVEYFRPGDSLLNRDNVGLVVLLKPNDAVGVSDPSAFICVANTHLLFNPRRGDVKLAQLAILLAEISRLSRHSDGSINPVVLCGDFNSTPWSPLYRFLTRGSLDYRGLQISMVSGQESQPTGQRFLQSPIWSHSLGIDQRCRYKNKPPAESSPSGPTVEGAISDLTVEDLASKAAFAFNRKAWIEHSLKLQSSYQHHLMSDGRPEITTCHSRTALTVDYILYTPEFLTPSALPRGRGLQLLDRLSLVGISELEEVDHLPNQYHSSDHLPLLARFRLRR